jgi:hypothetical protein
LSEASFSTFRYKHHDFSKKNAALIFCFFLIKQKEKEKCRFLSGTIPVSLQAY